MRITPLDIEQKRFPRKLKGYDPQEVRSFLQLVSGEIGELRKENADLKEETMRIEGQLKEFHDLEVSIRDAVITAHQFIEMFRADAERNAKLLERAAEAYAEEILKDLQLRVVSIHKDITELKGIRKHFKEEMLKLIADCLGKVAVE